MWSSQDWCSLPWVQTTGWSLVGSKENILVRSSKKSRSRLPCEWVSSLSVKVFQWDVVRGTPEIEREPSKRERCTMKKKKKKNSMATHRICGLGDTLPAELRILSYLLSPFSQSTKLSRPAQCRSHWSRVAIETLKCGKSKLRCMWNTHRISKIFQKSEGM